MNLNERHLLGSLRKIPFNHSHLSDIPLAVAEALSPNKKNLVLTAFGSGRPELCLINLTINPTMLKDIFFVLIFYMSTFL